MLFATLTLVASSLLPAGPPAVAGADPCAGIAIAEGEALPLVAVWTASRELEPGYAAAGETMLAGSAAVSAVRRERLPMLSLEAAGDHGQRARPGEERAIGIGARGDVRAIAGWTLLDSGRGWRVAEQRQRQSELRWAGEAFDAEFRAAVARLYVDAAAERAGWLLVLGQRDALAELARVVELRRAAGVEQEYDALLMEEALARFDRRLAESAHRAAAARTELAGLTGRCIEPAPLAPRTDAVPRTAEPDRNPLLRRLREQAAAQELAAGAVLRQDLWRLQVVGTGGPYFSEAFPDRSMEPEYFVGLAASVNPDLGGVRRARASAEQARGRALRLEVASQQRVVERQLARITHAWERLDQRRDELARELDITRRRADAAELRWQAGVDRWREVIDAQERLLVAHQQRVELDREVGHAIIELGAWTGELDAVPGWLGQEVAP